MKMSPLLSCEILKKRELEIKEKVGSQDLKQGVYP